MLKGSNKSEMCSCFKVPTGVILKQFAKENLRDTKACMHIKRNEISYNSPELGSELPSASVRLSGEACS